MGTVITDNTHCAQSPPFTPATGQWTHAFQSKYLVTNQHLTLETVGLFIFTSNTENFVDNGDDFI